MKKKNWQKPKSDHNVILVVAWIRGGKYFTPCNFSLRAPDVAKKQKADDGLAVPRRSPRISAASPKIAPAVPSLPSTPHETV